MHKINLQINYFNIFFYYLYIIFLFIHFLKLLGVFFNLKNVNITYCIHMQIIIQVKTAPTGFLGRQKY